MCRGRGILGDRSMSAQWGGSVLDSVVGAFLTQNASDVLSSKAWMTLQSRFPARHPGPKQSEEAHRLDPRRDIIDWDAVRRAPTEQVNAPTSLPSEDLCYIKVLPDVNSCAPVGAAWNMIRALCLLVNG